MKRKQVLDLIEAGENLHCEFKLRFSSSEKIAKEFMAFANTSGGYVLFGVDDAGIVQGVASEKEQAELIRIAAEEYCVPQIPYTIEYFSIEGKEVVVVYVPESQEKPHRLQDYKNELDITTALVYVRVSDKSIQASKEMIRILRASSNNQSLTKYTIGDTERRVFDYLEKHEMITVNIFSSNANISYRRASRTLVKLVRAGSLLIHVRDNGDEYFTLA